MGKYQRMTLAVRCQIHALLQVGVSIPEISKEVGFHKSSIYRELQRNSLNKKYCPRKATKLYISRQQQQGRNTKIDLDLESQIIDKLFLGWSPDQISGRLRKDNVANISHECIYQHIHKYPELKVFLRQTRRRGHGRYSQRKCKWRKKLHISKRPEVANNRERIGDWERDAMYLANREQLIVCTDRKSKYTKISYMKKLNSSWMNKETKRLLTSTGKKIYTITNDNGTEFRGSEDIGVPIYYCTPMMPQQRGTVENTVGLLRQFLRRTDDIKNISKEYLEHVETLINLRPRKGLDYLTPYEVFYNKKVAMDY